MSVSNPSSTRPTSAEVVVLARDLVDLAKLVLRRHHEFSVAERIVIRERKRRIVARLEAANQTEHF